MPDIFQDTIRIQLVWRRVIAGGRSRAASKKEIHLQNSCPAASRFPLITALLIGVLQAFPAHDYKSTLCTQRSVLLDVVPSTRKLCVIQWIVILFSD